MTKEELEKEARINLKRRFGEFFPQLTISYVMGAEPRERQIEELEKTCEETQELLDKQIEATFKLDKENAELKKEWQEQVQKATDEGYARTLQTIQLSKAKDLLKQWVELFKPKGGNMPPTPIQVETEQFLSEVEK